MAVVFVASKQTDIPRQLQIQIQAGSLANFDDGLQFKFATVRTNAGDEYTGQIIGVGILDFITITLPFSQSRPQKHHQCFKVSIRPTSVTHHHHRHYITTIIENIAPSSRSTTRPTSCGTQLPTPPSRSLSVQTQRSSLGISGWKNTKIKKYKITQYKITQYKRPNLQAQSPVIRYGAVAGL